jgi:hypothetical protein
MICAMRILNLILIQSQLTKQYCPKTDIYYFPYKINISSVRSIDDSMHTRTLEQTQ